MKFIYVDESGEQDHTDIFVMAGIMVDAYNLRKKTADFDALVQVFLEKHSEQPNEIKTSRLINGKGGWSKIPPSDRKQFLADICDLAVSNSGKIFGAAIHLPTFNKTMTESGDSFPFNKNKWTAAAMFVSSLIQKKMEGVKGNKGLTVFVMDHNHQCMPTLSDGLYQCDPWYDGLYKVRKKVRGKNTWKERTSTNRFDQIINTAFAIKSEHSSLVKVADVISYIYRRHLELQFQKEEYDGETDIYQKWVSQLNTHREKIGQAEPCPALEFYQAVSPKGWKL